MMKKKSEIPHLDHHLHFPMQCRLNSVTINGTSKFLTNDPTHQTHAITINTEDYDAENGNIILNLSLKGVNSYLQVHKPTKEGCQYQTYPLIELISKHLDWYPDSTRYTEQEEAMSDYKGEIVMPDTSSRGKSLVVNYLWKLFIPVSNITGDNNFYSVLQNKVQVPTLQSGNLRSKQGKSVDVLAIAKQWMISPDRDKNTVQKTTQRGIRTVINPHMSRRYQINERMLRYPCLTYPVFTDTMVSGTVSNCGNNNAQVYGTSFGWKWLFPMKLKSDAHETFSLIFKSDGVTHETIMDNSREQLISEFRKKLRGKTDIRK